MKKFLGILLALTMVFSLSVTAFAADGDVDVNGNIKLQDPALDPGGDPDHPGTDPSGRTYDVTFTTTVYWWVTEATFNGTDYDVVDGNASGPATVSNKIQNNNTTTGNDIAVSFKSFTLTNTAATTLGASGDLALYLTGDLAADGIGSQDLANGYSTATPYTADLVNGTPWTFGFDGTYSGAPTSTGIAPTYKITLAFTWA